jgi:zinc transport system permease protein
MLDFFHDISSNPFLLYGLAAGLLASLACGLVGPYVVTRRIVFLSGAIAHMAVGGIGAAIFLAYYFPSVLGWFSPLHGAAVAAIGAAIVLGVIHQRGSERIDTLIGALWAVGMALGILLLKLTPGYHDLMSYLFGNISVVGQEEVWLIFGLDLVVVVTVLVFHKRFLALCLDQQQAELQGINVMSVNLVMLCLVALTVIALTRVVGLILVIALLSLPAATASHHVRRMAPMMLVSTLLCAALTTLPRVAVYGTRISPEAAIVLASTGVYLASLSWEAMGMAFVRLAGPPSRR